MDYDVRARRRKSGDHARANGAANGAVPLSRSGGVLQAAVRDVRAAATGAALVTSFCRRLVLVRATAAEFRLFGVDEAAIALGVDERVNGVLRGRARNELAVPAPPSCMAGHPDVGG